jgi:hypothetical protein
MRGTVLSFTLLALLCAPSFAPAELIDEDHLARHTPDTITEGL